MALPLEEKAPTEIRNSLKSTSPLPSMSKTARSLEASGLLLICGSERNSFFSRAPEPSVSSLTNRLYSLLISSSETSVTGTDTIGGIHDVLQLRLVVAHDEEV